MDGTHRGQVGRVVATSAGMLWVKIADVDELVALPLSSIEAAATSTPRRDGSPQP